MGGPFFTMKCLKIKLNFKSTAEMYTGPLVNVIYKNSLQMRRIAVFIDLQCTMQLRYPSQRLVYLVWYT